jgi:hypothetical protein
VWWYFQWVCIHDSWHSSQGFYYGSIYSLLHPMMPRLSGSTRH